jgi:hypothetical protein
MQLLPRLSVLWRSIVSKSKLIVGNFGGGAPGRSGFMCHGDKQVGGGQNPAKMAVDSSAQSVRRGHSHTLQHYTKASPAHESKRWTGTVPPGLSDINPNYGRGIWDRLPPVFIPRGLDLDQAEFSRVLCLLH